MKSPYTSMPLANTSRHFAPTSDLLRAAIRREFESEMRGLIMAARMHGFQLEISGESMTYRAMDVQQFS